MLITTPVVTVTASHADDQAARLAELTSRPSCWSNPDHFLGTLRRMRDAGITNEQAIIAAVLRNTG